MTKRYRAIVSITFDEDDLQEFAENIGADDRLDPMQAVHGELDNLGIGVGWIEQFYVDDLSQIARLSEGMSIQISPHSEA